MSRQTELSKLSKGKRSPPLFIPKAPKRRETLKLSPTVQEQLEEKRNSNKFNKRSQRNEGKEISIRPLKQQRKRKEVKDDFDNNSGEDEDNSAERFNKLYGDDLESDGENFGDDLRNKGGENFDDEETESVDSSNSDAKFKSDLQKAKRLSKAEEIQALQVQVIELQRQ